MACNCICSVTRQQPACFSGWRVAGGTVSRPSRRGLRWGRGGSSGARVLRSPPVAAAWAAEADEAQGSYDSYEEEEEEEREPFRFDFVYMDAETSARIEAEREAAREVGLQEYAALKEWLLFRTWLFGLLFSGYLLIAASAEAAFCQLLGSAAGYGYLRLLMSDVEALNGDSRVPMREAELRDPGLGRNAAKLVAAYGQALRPRLLVLVGLVAGCTAWNSAFPEAQLGLVEEGCMLAGFLSYKVALVLKLYEDLKPKPLDADALMRQPRPVLAQVEDVTLDLRSLAKGLQEQQAEGSEAAEAAAPAAERSS